jgi:hypothetical protein
MQQVVLLGVVDCLAQYPECIARFSAPAVQRLLPALAAAVAQERLGTDVRFSCLKSLNDALALLLNGATHLGGQRIFTGNISGSTSYEFR